ncbi:MAG: MAPEG family protein [Hyphomicrobiales bacterium]|nr:MAPEG family protein [Hyphomicrobiales bacterium]MDE2018593.1 MAPEG family protein [Hyphomicrobiales bacterium]
MSPLAPELRWLAYACVIGFVHLAVQATTMTLRQGIGWNVGARDGAPRPEGALDGRAARALRNFLETFPLFAALALALVAAGRSGGAGAHGAALYVWARAAYVPIYLLGVPVLRTVVYGVSIAGLLAMLGALLA